MSFNLIGGCNGDILSNNDFKLGIKNKSFDAIVDVRDSAEWDAGHIEGATFVQNLASTGNAYLLKGCENCTLAVYCRTGSRAGQAIERLKSEFGFSGALFFNAGGVNQWTDAGNALIKTPSIPAACVNKSHVCRNNPNCPISCDQVNDFTTSSSPSTIKKNWMALSFMSAALIWSFSVL